MSIRDVDAEKAYRMAQEIQNLREQKIICSIDHWTAFCLLGVIQIALSHPEIGEAKSSTDQILGFARELTDCFKSAPICKEIIEQGWKDAHQVNPDLSFQFIQPAKKGN